MNSDEIIIGTDLGPTNTIVAMVCKEINITFLINKISSIYGLIIVNPYAVE